MQQIRRLAEGDLVVVAQNGATGFANLRRDFRIDRSGVGLDDHAAAVDARILDNAQVLDVAGSNDLVAMRADRIEVDGVDPQRDDLALTSDPEALELEQLEDVEDLLSA